MAPLCKFRGDGFLIETILMCIMDTRTQTIHFNLADRSLARARRRRRGDLFLTRPVVIEFKIGSVFDAWTMRFRMSVVSLDHTRSPNSVSLLIACGVVGALS